MIELLETIPHRGMDIKVYGTEEDGATRFETLGRSFPDQDGAEAAITLELDGEMETYEETLERHEDWRRRQWELV